MAIFKTDFSKTFVHNGYAVETLINGNLLHCISYLRELNDSGAVGRKVVHEELVAIKEQCPQRYDYVKDKVFY